MDVFAKVMRRRLLDTSTGLPKRYLQESVTEITFDGEVVRMQGRNAALLARPVDPVRARCWRRLPATSPPSPRKHFLICVNDPQIEPSRRCSFRCRPHGGVVQWPLHDGGGPNRIRGFADVDIGFCPSHFGAEVGHMAVSADRRQRMEIPAVVDGRCFPKP